MAKTLRLLTGVAMIAFFFLVYWYQSGAAICPVPIKYRLGSIDQRFALEESAVLDYIAKAEAVWEGPTKRDLFVYDETADFPINFVFDDRQAEADAEKRERTILDNEEAKNGELFATIEKLKTDYEALVAAHERQVAQYETALAAYNAEVTKHNDTGGASTEVFAELKKRQQALDRQVSELNARSLEIKDLAEKINQLSAEANGRIEEYNQEVSTYNNRYGSGEEITQGEYQGKEINVYKFSNEDELVAVLAHEFGHALGIGHVEEGGALMHYLLEDPTFVRVLSESDRAAFVSVCGEKETTGQKWRQIIREAFD